MSILATGEAAPATRAAWAGSPPHVAAARERLLEATARCIARDGLASTSVASVAGEAGVSRQTVYRYFSGRDDLAKRTIFATAEGLRGRIASQIAHLTDPADVVVEALVLGVTEIRSDPVLRGIWDSAAPDGLVAEIFTHPEGIAWTCQVLARAVELAGWSEVGAHSAIEFFLRIALSLLISPPPQRSDDELRAFLYRHLIPGLALATSEEI